MASRLTIADLAQQLEQRVADVLAQLSEVDTSWTRGGDGDRRRLERIDEVVALAAERRCGRVGRAAAGGGWPRPSGSTSATRSSRPRPDASATRTRSRAEALGHGGGAAPVGT